MTRFRPAALVAALLFVSLSAAPLAASGSPRVTILGYHVIGSPQDSRFAVTPESFREQMSYLVTTGYNVISLSELNDYVRGRKKSIPDNTVVVTVDDGWISTYTEMYPVMKELSLPFTLFIYPKFVGASAIAVDWSEVREMARNGVDIQSHTLSHAFLSRRQHASLSDADWEALIRKELIDSRRIIEQRTGKPVRYLAYPYGDYDRRVREIVAEAGYFAGITSEYGTVRSGDDPFRLKRIVLQNDTSLEQFRRYLGDRDSLDIDELFPEPGRKFDSREPVVSAVIRDHESLDPDSVRLALLSLGRTPYSYDARNGTISLVVRDPLPGRRQRAVVWGRDAKTGSRRVAVWTFYIDAPEIDTLPKGDIEVAGTPPPSRTAARNR